MMPSILSNVVTWVAERCHWAVTLKSAHTASVPTDRNPTDRDPTRREMDRDTGTPGHGTRGTRTGTADSDGDLQRTRTGTRGGRGGGPTASIDHGHDDWFRIRFARYP